MKMLGIAFLAIAMATVFVAVAIWLRRFVRSASLKTRRHHFQGFSVFDVQLTVGEGKGAKRPKREAALYLTVKTLPAEPISAAKLLFDEKVRLLGE